MADRTQGIPEICEIIDVLGQNDYRIGQSILNAIGQDVHDGNIATKLYTIENDELLALLKRFASRYMPS